MTIFLLVVLMGGKPHTKVCGIFQALRYLNLGHWFAFFPLHSEHH